MKKSKSKTIKEREKRLRDHWKDIKIKSSGEDFIWIGWAAHWLQAKIENMF